MFLTINEVNSDVYKWITCKESFLHLLVDTLFNSRNVAFADCSTLYSILEGIVLASFDWINLDDNSTELAMSTGLLLMGVFCKAALLCDGLTVCNLWNLCIDGDLLLFLDLIKNHVDVELTHTTDDGFPGLFVVLHFEGQVLFCDLVESIVHLVFTLLVSSGDGQLIDWLWQLERSEPDL